MSLIESKRYLKMINGVCPNCKKKVQIIIYNDLIAQCVVCGFIIKKVKDIKSGIKLKDYWEK